MSTPIIEHIAEFIKAAINDITTGNGFNQDLVAIRPKRIYLDDEVTKDLTVIIQQTDTREWEKTNSTQGWVQRFDVQAMVVDSDNAVVSIETRLNTVRSDIEKKLLEDIKCGGYAHDLQLLPPEFYAGADFTGVLIPVEVYYRTLYDDPYTKA